MSSEPADRPRIRLLPDEVKSRIAAGEVVERPASAVKELVENALDAGARSVHVELAGGGRELIRIADDGVGMGAEDLALAVRRHATSKLSSADELYELSTFGFRGEALPAIASVSRLKITSRPRPGDAAWQIHVTGGTESLVRPASGAFGTTVEIRDLFYNLPARLKFLKNPGAEASASTEMLVRLALVRPDVTFTLVQDGQEVFTCPAVVPAGAGPVAPFAQRARDILGSVATKGLVEIDTCYAPGAESVPPQAEPGAWPKLTGAADYRLFGLLSSPAHTRPNRSNVYLSVNGRAVRDRTFAQAVVEAYRQWLPARRFPAAVLFLELPGTDVDINVHPTKAEVRFRYPSRVFSLVHHAVRALFAPERNAATAQAGSPVEVSQASVPPVVSRPTTAQGTFDLWQGARTVETQSLVGSAEVLDLPAQRAAEEKGTYLASPAPSRSLAAPSRSASVAAAPEASPLPVPAGTIPPFRILGQAGGSYIVYEDDEGLKILDQHAAHERVLFEQLVEKARTGSRADAQRLLLPESVELTPQQSAALSDVGVRATIEELGFELADFGPRAVLVQAVPVVLKGQKAPQYVGEILDGLTGDLDGGRRPTRATLREKAAYVLSCKGAIKAGELLNTAQMNALLIEFFRRVARRGGTCPHGRPVAVEFTWEELERKVGR